MILLALDTSTEACSAALYNAGEVVERFELAPRAHNLMILSMIDRLLADSGLHRSAIDGVAFGCGPGSFTGVRIAASVTQGFAFGLNLPVYPVSTLKAMAYAVFRQHASMDYVIPCIDARMSEVYFSIYQRPTTHEHTPEAIYAERVISPEHIDLSKYLLAGTVVGAGTGWGKYPAELARITPCNMTDIRVESFPHAQDIARLAVIDALAGISTKADSILPRYLRDNVAQKRVA